MKSKLMFALHPVITLCCLLFFAGNAISQQTESQPGQGGPYNGSFIASGIGLEKTIPAKEAPLSGTSVWSMYCWVRSEGPFPSKTLLAGFGDPRATGAAQRYLGVIDGNLAFWSTGGACSALFIQSRIGGICSPPVTMGHLCTLTMTPGKLHPRS